MAAKNASKAPTKAKKKSYSLSGLYDAKGDEIKRKKQTCPKCGPSFYLADHANRVTCGKCGYTEFKKN